MLLLTRRRLSILDGVDEDAFRDAVLSWARSDKNGVLHESYTCRETLRNPLCGDEVEIRLTLSEGRITESSFRVRGCAICTASTALMDELLPGMTVDEARSTAAAVDGFICGDPEILQDGQDDGAVPEDVTVFAPLQGNPRRRECALLPWRVVDVCLSDLH